MISAWPFDLTYDGRFLRRLSLVDGLIVCPTDALDLTTASPAEIAQQEAINAQVIAAWEALQPPPPDPDQGADPAHDEAAP